MSYCIPITLLVLDVLIFFVSRKVFVDSLAIILHTNIRYIGMHCAMGCKVAAGSIYFNDNTYIC